MPKPGIMVTGEFLGSERPLAATMMRANALAAYRGAGPAFSTRRWPASPGCRLHVLGFPSCAITRAR